MKQLEHIDAIEKRLWGAADQLRANSKLASNEYFLPVMGLVFLRHAYNRYLKVKRELEAEAPTRHGKKRPLSKEGFSAKRAIFLKPNAQFDHLVGLPDSADRAKAVSDAMNSIEKDYESLRGVLPKEEYRKLDNARIGELLRTLNSDELQHVSGDVFGRIYEYFLTQFADKAAHDGGEFFTPVSLVSLIAHVLDPERGTVLDPACGSGGMFVQSAHTVEERGKRPSKQLTFKGMEKNATTIRLAKMNLAVHGLEGNIQQAITYYDDPHKLFGKADFVMANPPFNVDEIDAEKIENDQRLPFGLPGVNKKGKVSNGNYVWISYFHSYLNARGRAGFVMSSQASSAGGKEAAVRRKLVDSGDVEAMIAIRGNFFYIRPVPCELWFLNRAKPTAQRDRVLMIDARSIYRQITRKICDFSPAQQRNLLAIVFLYRGERERYLGLLAEYCARVLAEAIACFGGEEESDADKPLIDFHAAIRGVTCPSGNETDASRKLKKALSAYESAATAFHNEIKEQQAAPQPQQTNAAIKKASTRLAGLTDGSREVAKQVEQLHSAAAGMLDARARKAPEAARQLALAQLEKVQYCHREMLWLIERFPDAKLRDIPGLVKVVSREEIAANDWSLSPGRYVGVAPEQTDENFDFAGHMRALHAELRELDVEAGELAGKIEANFGKMDL